MSSFSVRLRSSAGGVESAAFDAGEEQLTLNQWAEGSSPSEVTEDKPLTEVGGFLFVVCIKHRYYLFV